MNHPQGHSVYISVDPPDSDGRRGLCLEGNTISLHEGFEDRTTCVFTATWTETILSRRDLILSLDPS
jgi:hypothetical protein